jgi:hypothetical protein
MRRAVLADESRNGLCPESALQFLDVYSLAGPHLEGRGVLVANETACP